MNQTEGQNVLDSHTRRLTKDARTPHTHRVHQRGPWFSCSGFLSVIQSDTQEEWIIYIHFLSATSDWCDSWPPNSPNPVVFFHSSKLQNDNWMTIMHHNSPCIRWKNYKLIENQAKSIQQSRSTNLNCSVVFPQMSEFKWGFHMILKLMFTRSRPAVLRNC